jgi:hypothetical protein
MVLRTFSFVVAELPNLIRDRKVALPSLFLSLSISLPLSLSQSHLSCSRSLSRALSLSLSIARSLSVSRSLYPSRYLSISLSLYLSPQTLPLKNRNLSRIFGWTRFAAKWQSNCLDCLGGDTRVSYNPQPPTPRPKGGVQDLHIVRTIVSCTVTPTRS